MVVEVSSSSVGGGVGVTTDVRLSFHALRRARYVRSEFSQVQAAFRRSEDLTLRKVHRMATGFQRAAVWVRSSTRLSYTWCCSTGAGVAAGLTLRSITLARPLIPWWLRTHEWLVLRSCGFRDNEMPDNSDDCVSCLTSIHLFR